MIIGAPYMVTEELLSRFSINLVVQGSRWIIEKFNDYRAILFLRTEHHDTIGEVDCYKVPKQFGIFMTIDSGNDMTTDLIIDRIIDHK